MKGNILRYIVVFVAFLIWGRSNGQSIHFSQYYDAPLLLNPANTGLMPEYDFRAGLNYRNQWSVIPVPYNTFSAFVDGKINRNRDRDKKNWLGLGLAFFNDNAGDGNLSLVTVQGSIAYHLEMNERSMISLGFSGANVNRSINYDLLSFDAQWDGFTFNKANPNYEKTGVVQTHYTTIGAGFNFAYFPNDDVYAKLGVGVANVNTPTESFYGRSNKVGMRPMANLDLFYHTGPLFIINPSAYYSTQNGADEIIVGSLFRANLGGVNSTTVTQFILGGFWRLGDAIIGTVGVQVGSIQFMANYDMTISTLAPYNGSYGAMEVSLIYQGLYNRDKYNVKTMMGCPRFF